MKLPTGIFAALLAGTLITLAADASAQFGGGRPGGGRMRGDGPPSGGFQGAPRISPAENIVELIEFRLLSLQEDLKLAPAQGRFFDAYADRVRAIAADIARERVRVQNTMYFTAVQQMDRAVDSVRNRLTALEDVAANAKTLYETLSPEQKMLADSRFATITPLIAGTSSTETGGPSGTRQRPGDGGGYGPPPRDGGAGEPRRN